jgi:hypothetical protein
VLPEGASIHDAHFAGDARYLVLEAAYADGIHLVVADTGSGSSELLRTPAVSDAHGEPCDWVDAGDRVLCRFAVKTGLSVPPLSFSWRSWTCARAPGKP